MLNMRSDQTAVARIRDAAIEVFGRRGLDAATVREIAQQAEVSPALVIHHYGSKERLREHCDDYLMAEGLRIGDEVDLDDQPAVAAMIASFPPGHPWLVYIARLVLDGGAPGAALWDRMAAEATAALESGAYPLRLRDGVDPAAATALATALGLLPLVFQTHLARSLGASTLDGEPYQRVMTTLMDLLMNGLYQTPTQGAQT